MSLLYFVPDPAILDSPVVRWAFGRFVSLSARGQYSRMAALLERNAILQAVVVPARNDFIRSIRRAFALLRMTSILSFLRAIAVAACPRCHPERRSRCEGPYVGG